MNKLKIKVAQNLITWQLEEKLEQDEGNKRNWGTFPHFYIMLQTRYKPQRLRTNVKRGGFTVEDIRC